MISTNYAGLLVAFGAFEAPFFDEVRMEMDAIHSAFLAGLNESAFPNATARGPNREEVIREPRQLVKQRLDPETATLGGRLTSLRLSLTNAEKTRGRAFDARPLANARTR